jgi:hypothetical protein
MLILENRNYVSELVILILENHTYVSELVCLNFRESQFWRTATSDYQFPFLIMAQHCSKLSFILELAQGGSWNNIKLNNPQPCWECTMLRM